MLLSACGFTPLYATGGDSIAGEMREVFVGDVSGPPDASYYVSDSLRDVLPDEAGAEMRYRLRVALRDQRRAIAVTRAAATTRYDYVLNAAYTLTDLDTGAVRRHELETVVSYGVVASQYASLVGREDAVRRAATDLARRIETDVALYLKGRAPDTARVPLPPVIDDEPLEELPSDEGDTTGTGTTIPEDAEGTQAPAGAGLEG
jgi:LPS-assembly lipoprotein